MGSLGWVEWIGLLVIGSVQLGILFGVVWIVVRLQRRSEDPASESTGDA